MTWDSALSDKHTDRGMGEKSQEQAINPTASYRLTRVVRQSPQGDMARRRVSDEKGPNILTPSVLANGPHG